MSTAVRIPYQPFGNQQEQRVGRLRVVGNSSMASVVKQGLVPASIHLEDNEQNGVYTDYPEPDAFKRAVTWAENNQDKAGESLFRF